MEKITKKYYGRNKSVEYNISLKDLLKQQRSIRKRDEDGYKKLKEKFEFVKKDCDKQLLRFNYNPYISLKNEEIKTTQRNVLPTGSHTTKSKKSDIIFSPPKETKITKSPPKSPVRTLDNNDYYNDLKTKLDQQNKLKTISESKTN